MSLIQVLLSANLLLLAVLLAWLWVLHRKTTALREAARQLAASTQTLPRDLQAELRRIGAPATPFYTIEILNPLEVAAQESWLGDLFGGLTPALVRREVYRKAHAILHQQLTERGIKAEVKLHEPA